MPAGHFVYILSCSDSSYYIGLTTDPHARVKAHNDGFGPRYTARRRPVELVYYEQHKTMSQARQRELQLKKWSRAKKQALIAGHREKLRALSRCRNK